MNTIAISDFRTKLPTLIDKIGKRLERVIITVSGKPKAVVMSLDELESLEETAEILSFPHAYKKIKQGAQEAEKGKGILLEKRG
jgi:antitoxin YefM